MQVNLAPTSPRVPLPGLANWLLRWEPHRRKTVYLCVMVLGVCAIAMTVYIRKQWDEYAGQAPAHPAAFGDFFALWSYAKIAYDHPVAELYDFAALHARQVALGMDPAAQNPFPYPPTFMILLWPLGQLPYEAAYLVWIGGSMALFVWALIATCSRLPLCVAAAVVAPFSTAVIASGQSGFLAGALIVAGVRYAGRRPVLGGLLIGILSYKPQLGILVPVALAAAGYWRAFGTACLVVAGMALLATLAFGWAVWPAWISMLPTYADMFDRETVGLKFMPTVTANLRMVGVSPPVANAMQALAAVGVAMVVWDLFRRHRGRLAVAALLVGTFLATPHAFIYDMPMLVGALALFIETRLQLRSTFTLAEVLILLAGTLFPLLMMATGINLPVSTLPLLLLFGLIAWHSRRAGLVLGSNILDAVNGQAYAFGHEQRTPNAG